MGSLRTLSDQVALVPNMAGLGALEQRVADLDQRVGALDQRVIALDQRVTDNHQVLLYSSIMGSRFRPMECKQQVETIRTNQRLILEQMQINHRDPSRSDF